jgi:hypothetical protein
MHFGLSSMKAKHHREYKAELTIYKMVTDVQIKLIARQTCAQIKALLKVFVLQRNSERS